MEKSDFTGYVNQCLLEGASRKQLITLGNIEQRVLAPGDKFANCKT